MSVTNDIQNSILKAIDTMAQRRIDQLQLDKTITAIINAPVGVKNGRKIYKVEYEGGYFNATAQNKDDAYLPRMAVYVQVPQGDFSKEKFILGQASKLATDEQVSVVSATNSSFSIVGKNVIDNKTEKMGVYSYHSPTEEENSNTLNHRFNFLYKSDQDQEENQITINNENLNLYKKNATAIMIRAEFMTKLTNEQKKKATGEYGLVFDLVFNNSAAGFGETQGKVFDHFRETTKVTKIVDGKDQELSLDTIDKELNKVLNEKSYEELINTNGYLDEILSDIQELDRVYKNNNKVEYTFMVQDLMSKYTVLIQDIKRAKDVEQMKEWYQNWRKENVGQPVEKHVSYYLSSNDMIGNPFSFSSWISQYNIFEIDLDNFLRIDSILLYKQGFIEDDVKETKWLEHEPDILVRDIQVYAMQPLSDNNAGYQLKVESPDTGSIFRVEDSEDSIITVNAILLRQYYEDLTRNSNTRFHWFEQDESIVSPMQEGYSLYAREGWKEIENENSTKLRILKKYTKARENHFKCVAEYNGEEVPITLQYNFIIYNKSRDKFVLQSDLGTDFSFGAGTPTITIYKQIENEDGTIELKELHTEDYIRNQQYKFKWAIIDNNNQKTFLNVELEDTTVINFNNEAKTSKLLEDIKWFNGDKEVTTDIGKSYATKLQYPMSNIANSASITFECYISYREENETIFSPLGKTQITLNNFEIQNANSYRAWIENGDQVFQYDEYGNAPNVAKYKDPIEVLPLKMHLFAPNNIEVQDSNFRTKWYLPIQESLIEYSNVEIDPATGFANLIKANELSFDIKKLYDYNALDNQIKCQIEFNDQIINIETSFNFTKVGNNGTNGTDVVAKIDVKEDKWKNILFSQPFTLYVDKVENKVISNIDTIANDEFVLTDYLESKIYQKSQEITDTDRIQTRWNIAGNTSTATNKKGKNIDIKNNGLVWKNIDESAKKIYHQYILKSETTYREKTQSENANNKKTYYAFYSLPVIFYENNIPTQESVRIAIDRDTYLKEVVYNADGRNPLYSQNQGLKLLNIPDNCVVSWEACGGYNAAENRPNFQLLLEKDNKKEAAKLWDYTENQSQVWILPEDEFSGAVTNNYIKAQIFEKITSQEEEEEFSELTDNEKAALEIFDTSYKVFMDEREKLLEKIEQGDEEASGQLQILETDFTYWCNNILESHDNILYSQIIAKCNKQVFFSSANFVLTYLFTHIRENNELTQEQENFLLDTIFSDVSLCILNDDTYYKIIVENAKAEINNIITQLNQIIEQENALEEEWGQQENPPTEEQQEEHKEQWVKETTTYLDNIIAKCGADFLNNMDEREQEVRETFGYKLIATVIAPINMSLNTFGLASMNAWDGNSIATDEDAGTIYAPQIGAGYKDSETNLFTGVVMGQADDYSSGKEHLYTGLMGYKDGMRSFFLDSETGNAIFGYPTLATDSDKVRKYENGEWTEIDNYNEGEIKLIPGGESVVGGWRLGRKSLYYTESKFLGNRYSVDYVPNTSGSIEENDIYNAHHLKDIEHDDSGVLLYSGEYPYLSIKGKKLTNAEINSSLNSNLLPGDSLEVQLDPITPTLFTIFRHNGKTRIDATSTMKPNSRTFLAGINSKGELVANAIGAVAGGNGTEGSGTATKSTVNLLKAFTDTQNSEPSYVGALFEAGNYTIGQLFIDKNITSNGTLYITGGQNVAGDEYCRPISIHGRSISLYSSNNSDTDNQKTTNQFIKIDSSTNNGQFLLQTNSNNKIEFNDNNTNCIYTQNNLDIDTTKSGSNKAFNLTTGAQTIIAKASIGVTSVGYTLNSSNAININTIGDYNIAITRNGGSNINIGSANIGIKINDNNEIVLNSDSTNASTYLKSSKKIEIKNTSSNGIYFETIGSANNNNTTKLSIKGRANDTSNQRPFELDMGSNIGELYVLRENTTNNAKWIVSMDENIAGGLQIDGPYQGQSITPNSTGSLSDLRIDISNDRWDSITKKTYHGAIKSAYFVSTGGTESGAHGYTFDTTETIYADTESYNYSASGKNLYDLIQDCLKAASSARSAAKSAHDAADAAQSKADSAYELAGTKVSKDTYNGHKHNFNESKRVTLSKNVSVSDISDIYAMYTPETFRAEKDGDNVRLSWETSPELRAENGASAGQPGAIESFHIYGQDGNRDISISDTISFSGTSETPSPQAH